MNWIPIRTDLPQDPAFQQIAEQCNLPGLYVVGALWAVWAWFNMQTCDGKASINVRYVDKLAGVDGFADAMKSAGWLKSNAQYVWIPHFDRFNSVSAKARMLNTQRKAAQRRKEMSARDLQNPEASPLCRARSATQARHKRDTSATREQRTAESEDIRRESADSAASAPGTTKATERQTRRGRPQMLRAIFNQGADAAVQNGVSTQFRAQEILSERGCDPSFRSVVSRIVDIRTIRKLAAEYDARQDRITNSGGWWRDRLRREGVQGI